MAAWSVRDGLDDTQPQRQRYRREACAGRFDDLTGTVLAGHRQPPRIWVLCLYLMGLNLSYGIRVIGSPSWRIPAWDGRE